MKIAILAGDGVGPEITAEARNVLDALALPEVAYWEGDVGGAGYRRHGHPLPPDTLEMAKAADAMLFGAVGDPAATTSNATFGPSRRSSACARIWACSPICARRRCSRPRRPLGAAP